MKQEPCIDSTRNQESLLHIQVKPGETRAKSQKDANDTVNLTYNAVQVSR